MNRARLAAPVAAASMRVCVTALAQTDPKKTERT
jgi:hypothetical protein